MDSNLQNIDWRNAKNLIKIIVHNNRISEIPEGSFSLMTSLEEVDFQGNQITDLDGDLFKKNLKLKKVDFSDNILKTVGIDIFEGNVALINLKFANCGCIDKSEKIDFKKFIEELTSNCSISSSNDELMEETTLSE